MNNFALGAAEKKEIMKKLNLLVLGLIVVAGLSSCLKETETFDLELQYEIEKPIIAEYVRENVPNAVLNEDWGIWYEIIEPGTAGDYEYKMVNNQIEAPVIQAKYRGILLNGVQFDANDTTEGATFSLNQVILAWQIVFLPSVIDGNETIGLTATGLHPGAKIRFVTPSYLGYANSARNNIPANSPLDFTIEVLDVRSPSSN